MARKKPERYLKRQPKKLKLRAKILIVCEGQKTEKEYFEYLKKKYRLTTAEVKIKEDGGSSPNSVFKDALYLYNESLERNQVAYDAVYCVYDQDEFSQHADVKNKIKQQKDFNLIFSNPCFEVWYLFHDSKLTKPFMKSGSKTASQQVKSEANKLLKSAGSKYLEFLFDRTDQAIENARNNSKQNIDNPYTDVHKLVEEMLKITKIKP
ncbi:RloB family protein [Psychrobacter sp. HII-4]|uniref:RloB family protein n=1 Tax=Psychrobacter sp. HII-4 TaxID=1569264 RepID=UPI00191B762B|nr:RloB family protein [Psychrobacter sp. HII-4]